MTLGQKLRFYRTAEGYSQQFMADLVGVERSSYTYYEKGKTQPSVSSLLKISRVLGVTMEVLADESLEPVGAAEFLAAKRRKKAGYHMRNIKNKQL